MIDGIDVSGGQGSQHGTSYNMITQTLWLCAHEDEARQALDALHPIHPSSCHPHAHTFLA
jgi:hypothetical protein